MNGLVIDLFAGGGGASVALEKALGRPVDIAINHDPTAIAVHRTNHPGTLHLDADVWEVRPLDATGGRPVDVLWASPDCFPAGTLILTERGQVPIEAVTIGDRVLTHRGRWRAVTATTAKDSKTVELRGYGHYGLVTTANHPFYSKHITKRYPGRKNAAGKRPSLTRELVENPYWPKAEDMAGKLWATPRAYPEVPIPTCTGAELSEDFFYFVGRWLGDGSLNKGDVEICCGALEIEELGQRMDAHPLKRADGQIVPWRVVDHESSKLLVWGNAALGRWLAEQFGVGCEGKALPAWCLAMQANWRRALLMGYVDADGYRGARTDTGSVSKALSIGVRLLAVSLGFAAALYCQPGKPGQIENRAFVGRDLYRVGWREELQRQTVHWDRLHMFSPVREVTPTGRIERVYCLTVDEDESYVADGIVVHNCRHFSVAKGDVPRSPKIRSLAWVVVRWAREVKPQRIFLENVQEFRGWGPLGRDGKPDKSKVGKTFRAWKRSLERLGYVVDYRVLDASQYGAPTRRRRLFLVARLDGGDVVWPEPTHGPGRAPLRTAAECIDWSIPCPSIFERKRPLAEKTMWRIAQGIRKFVIESANPFIIKVNHGRWEPRHESIEEPLSTVTATQRGHALVAPTLIQTGYGERPGQAARVPGLGKPLGTCVDGQKHALVSAFIARHFGGPRPVIGSECEAPLPTVTATDHHSLAAVTLAKFHGTGQAQDQSASADVREPLPTITAHTVHIAEVRAFLTAYYGSDATSGQQLDLPLRTATTRARFGIVVVGGVEHQIVDIGMRMLEPHELLRAQFGRYAAGYDLSEAKTKAAKIRLIGNSVPPEPAELIIRANTPNAEARAA